MATSETKTALEVEDPQVYDIIKKEEERQREGLELIASENFTSQAVMEAVGSCLTNKYSEGLPGHRYYGGNEQIDRLEALCQERALAAFHLDPNEWGVNVQAYSGSVANFAAFTALLEPGQKVMGLSLPSGGHLSHGYFRKSTKVNISAKYFSSLPYDVDPETGLVDYDQLESDANRFYPDLIIAGGSAYARDWDYERMSKIAKSVNAKLMCDIAHYSGLVASKLLKSPFEFADVVTTTTHKSLRGPRAALVFYRKELERKVNTAVFPACQGGPHNHAIAGIAVQLKEVASPEFVEYSKQVIANSRALAEHLKSNGYKIVTGGTDTHLVLWDLRPLGLTGSKLEALCDEVKITINKNTVPGDGNAKAARGVRIGAPALTSRGFKEEDFQKVGDFLHRCVELSLSIQQTSGSRLADFKNAFKTEDVKAQLQAIEDDVKLFAGKFAMPGKIL